MRISELPVDISFAIPYPAADSAFWFCYMLIGSVLLVVMMYEIATRTDGAGRYCEYRCTLRSLRMMARIVAFWPLWVHRFVRALRWRTARGGYTGRP